jgi:RNA-directed DNA polymerase
MTSPSKTFRSTVTQTNLREIFRTYINPGSQPGRDGVRPVEYRAILDIELKLINKRLQSGTYGLTPYRQVLKIKNSSNPPRELSIPTVRDRIAIKSIALTLASVFETPQISLPQAKIDEAVQAIDSGQFDSFVRIDVKDFYPSIDHRILFTALKRKIQSNLILKPISDIISNPTKPDGHSPISRTSTVGVPQGLSISNLLAEIYMDVVDKALSSRNGVFYTRYVDDILILCRSSDIQKVCKEVDDELLKVALHSHPMNPGSKSNVGFIKDGFDYLGYYLSSAIISVRPASRYRVESSISRAFTRYKYATRDSSAIALASPVGSNKEQQRLFWYVNLIVSGCIYDKARHGWMHYYSMVSDQTLLKQLDLQVTKQLKKNKLGTKQTPKSFLKTHWLLKHPNRRQQNYIINFDTFDDNQKRDVLNDIYDYPIHKTASWSHDKIEAVFASKIKRLAAELERDVGSLS